MELKQLPARPSLKQYKKQAKEVVKSHKSGEAETLRRIRLYHPNFNQLTDAEVRNRKLTLADAQWVIACEHGFESWPKFALHIAATLKTLPAEAVLTARPVKLFQAEREQASHNWNEVFAWLQQGQITGLNAQGQMTDELLARLAHCEHLTSLQLEGSQAVTDAGLRHLARLPNLQHLNLTNCPITDDGLRVLRELPALRTFQLFHHYGVTDAGLSHLADCHQLERVEVLGTPTGDGTIKAVTGKAKLRHLKTGNCVTDAGLALLHEFPIFKSWQGEEISMRLLGFDAKPNHLLLRGSFTDVGIAKLVGLDGLFALNLDDTHLALTAECFRSLAQLPRLGWLGYDATDATMPHIAALPHLRFLMCQDTVAGDAGFAALSRSQTIEYIWGRRCHNLRARGFAALAEMPALRALSVSCKNVDDSGLAALPDFPALRELMPMDVPDAGYCHIARCTELERLVLMYCRDTGDAATEHLTALKKLKYYFASYNLITDRSLELLSQISSLEHIELVACAGVTDAGLPALARLPRLREIMLGGLPNVTIAGAAILPAHVRLRLSLE